MTNNNYPKPEQLTVNEAYSVFCDAVTLVAEGQRGQAAMKLRGLAWTIDQTGLKK